MSRFASVRRARVLEAVLLLLAALLFARVCTLPLGLLARAGAAAPTGRPAAAVACPSWFLPFDDAYIFIRYAQQAARGRPLEWSPGEPSTGASSFILPWLLVPAHWLSRDLAVWSWWSRLVGVLSLWLLGAAAARALRALGLPDPWPLAAGLAAVWSGPVGLGAVAGMESALNAGLIVLACALWIEGRAGVDGRGRGTAGVWALVLVAILPLVRPENGLLALLAAIAVLLGGSPFPSRIGGPAGRLGMAVLVLLPGAGLALLDRLLTGELQPAGAIAKSWLAAPFVPPGTLVFQYLYTFRDLLLPVYLGTGSRGILWPPVGWLALATVAATAAAALRPRALPQSLGRLLPLAVAWAALVALAPLSGVLTWQEMRHHHAGLACAWVLAAAGLGLAAERLIVSRGWGRHRWTVLLLPLPLLLALPHWARLYTEDAVHLYRTHAPALAWLAAHGHERVLLLNDAGLLAIVHDGPAIDVMGLGNPDLTRAYRHGAGALVESLARRARPPEIAAVTPALTLVPELLGAPLLPGRFAADDTVLTAVRKELLQDTALKGEGIDFAYLPDEERAGIRWLQPPGNGKPSLALLEAGPGGRPSLQG